VGGIGVAVHVGTFHRRRRRDDTEMFAFNIPLKVVFIIVSSFEYLSVFVANLMRVLRRSRWG
jgi:hypothetical protein